MTTWVQSLLSGLVGALIGGALAVVGALLGARRQARDTVTMARQIRREERREAGLLASKAKVAEVVKVCDTAFRAGERVPDQWRASWATMYDAVEQLRLLWNADVSAKMPDHSVVAAYGDVRGQASDCASRLGTPGDQRVPAAGPQDFQREAGRLLMLLGELGKAIDGQLADLDAPSV